ncbi:MAG: hypothetical protein IPJ47_15715 [Anaerolineales bacterium]|nr:hypothetical protein [Anaerolineales bacterium]
MASNHKRRKKKAISRKIWQYKAFWEIAHEESKYLLDSSALIAGVISENGAAHVLLQLGETENVSLKISEFVFNETTRSIGRKSPENLENVRERSRRQELSFFKTPT